MAAFEAARFNHSRTSPRRETWWSEVFYQVRHGSRHVQLRFEQGWLLLPQGFHGVHLHGAAGRDVTGKQRNQTQQE
jgi:hypothetical protein